MPADGSPRERWTAATGLPYASMRCRVLRSTWYNGRCGHDELNSLFREAAMETDNDGQSAGDGRIENLFDLEQHKRQRICRRFSRWEHDEVDYALSTRSTGLAMRPIPNRHERRSLACSWSCADPDGQECVRHIYLAYGHCGPAHGEDRDSSARRSEDPNQHTLAVDLLPTDAPPGTEVWPFGSITAADESSRNPERAANL